MVSIHKINQIYTSSPSCSRLHLHEIVASLQKLWKSQKCCVDTAVNLLVNILLWADFPISHGSILSVTRHIATGQLCACLM